jgi:hypothetical protein
LSEEIVDILSGCIFISIKIIQVVFSKPCRGKGTDGKSVTLCYQGCLILIGISILLRLHVFYGPILGNSRAVNYFYGDIDTGNLQIISSVVIR